MRPIPALVLTVTIALAVGLWVVYQPNSLPFDLPDIVATAKSGTSQFLAWLRDSYGRFPAIIIGLAALVVLPLLALAGMMVRSIKRAGRTSRKTPKNQTTTPAIPQYQGLAWIRIVNPARIPGETKVMLDSEMLRIGRENDNDICLDDSSVHRYHALIQRTPDAEFVIADLSGRDGNGIWVNGARLSNGVLTDGDDIRLGKMRLLFGVGETKRNAA